MTVAVVEEFQRQLVLWREEEAFLDIVDWLVKVFTLQLGPMVVVLAVHGVEVVDEAVLDEVLKPLLAGAGVHR